MTPNDLKIENWKTTTLFISNEVIRGQKRPFIFVKVLQDQNKRIDGLVDFNLLACQLLQ